MPFDPTKFYLGVNIGWLNGAYRHDLGRAFKDAWSSDPPPDSSYPPSDPRHDKKFAEIIDVYFSHLNFRQIKVVRVWLLEGLEGMTFTGGSFLRPSKTDSFSLDNYSTYVEPRIKIIMKKAQKYSIQIYWCLLDAAGLLPSNKPPSWYRPLFKFLVETAGQNFKKDILLPFLKSIDPFKANVFAIDIVNEVDWSWDKGIMRRSTVVSFIRDIYNFIVGHLPSPGKYKCTTSFHSYKGLTKTGLPQNEKVDFLDFYDYHRYFDPAAPTNSAHGSLPNWSGGKPCIIGEAGHKYGNNPTKKVDENKQAKSSKTLMDQALKENYNGVLLWRYAPVGDPHRLLRLTKTDTGSTSFQTTLFTNFLNRFKVAAAASTSGGLNPFKDFERPIWNKVPGIVKEIKNKGKMP